MLSLEISPYTIPSPRIVSIKFPHRHTYSSQKIIYSPRRFDFSTLLYFHNSPGLLQVPLPLDTLPFRNPIKLPVFLVFYAPIPLNWRLTFSLRAEAYSTLRPSQQLFPARPLSHPFITKVIPRCPLSSGLPSSPTTNFIALKYDEWDRGRGRGEGAGDRLGG